MTKTLTLRDARLRCRPPLTQVELAALVGVDQTYISLLESGRRSPSDDVRKKLAKAVRVAAARLSFSTPETVTA